MGCKYSGRAPAYMQKVFIPILKGEEKNLSKNLFILRYFYKFYREQPRTNTI